MKIERGHLVAGFLLAQAWTFEASAQTGHGAHAHGEGTLSAVIERGVVAVEITLPGADVVGFEHEAKAEDDIKSVRQALDKLADIPKVLTLSAPAGCTAQSTMAETSLLREGAAGSPTDRSKGAEAHGGFTALYELKCEKPDLLTAISVHLFELFPSLHEVDAVVVSGNRQTAKTLTARESTISLVQ